MQGYVIGTLGYKWHGKYFVFALVDCFQILDIMIGAAGMLEDVKQAKLQVADFREQEKEAQKCLSAAQALKKGRKKGGAGE
jgi:hypothetical protein